MSNLPRIANETVAYPCIDDLLTSFVHLLRKTLVFWAGGGATLKALRMIGNGCHDCFCSLAFGRRGWSMGRIKLYGDGGRDARNPYASEAIRGQNDDSCYNG